MLHNICIDMGDANVDDLPRPANMVDQDLEETAPPLPAPVIPPPLPGQRQIARTAIVQIFAETLAQNRSRE